jgi:hypothetical protein
LSQAYPWVASGVAIVPLLSRFVFIKRVGSLCWFEVALIYAEKMIT